LFTASWRKNCIANTQPIRRQAQPNRLLSQGLVGHERFDKAYPLNTICVLVSDILFCGVYFVKLCFASRLVRHFLFGSNADGLQDDAT
jgi:hypothetical protein